MDKPLRHRINAGRVALKNQVNFFHRQFAQVPSEWKEDDTRVTFADFAISERIFAELRKSFAQDDYCSEESNPADEVMDLRARYAWVLDPIDGTNNYALGIPMCAISLALLCEGKPTYGFIYDMARRELIEGGPGLGVRNGTTKATIKQEAFGRHSLVGVHFPLRGEEATVLSPLTGKYRVRSLGSGALHAAYAAIGLLDGAIDFRVKVWDIAAAWALLEGGGGTGKFLDFNPFPMKQFHVNQPYVPYIAGTPSFVQTAEALLKPGKE